MAAQPLITDKNYGTNLPPLYESMPDHTIDPDNGDVAIDGSLNTTGTIGASGGLNISNGGVFFDGLSSPDTDSDTQPLGRDSVTNTVGASYVIPILKRYTFTHAALTQATNGATQTLTISMPEKTILLGGLAKTVTPFSGGGATAVTVDVTNQVLGSNLVTGYDAFAAASVTNFAPFPYPGSSNIGLFLIETFNPAGWTVNIDFTPDAGHNLLALTAGEIEIQLLTVMAR